MPSKRTVASAIFVEGIVLFAVTSSWRQTPRNAILCSSRFCQMDCVPSTTMLPFGSTCVTVTVTLPATLFVSDFEPCAENESEPFALAALRKSKMPTPAESEVLPLFLLELLFAVVVVVDSLMTIVRISPTLRALRSAKIL